MDKLDMCDAISHRKVSFVLNPNNEWETFPPHLKSIVNGNWYEVKYFDGDTNTINPETATIPNTCGGIYVFLIKANIIPDIHLYIAYIGRAHYTGSQNLRKRVRSYASETKRLKICNMKRLWSPYLYARYLPLDDNDMIDELEDELIKSILPPFNDRYPKIYNVSMKAAF